MFSNIPLKKIWPIALPLAIITFVLSRVLWPDAPDAPLMPSVLVPHFMFISALESLAFGVGAAFAMLSWRYVKSDSSEESTLTLATFWSVTWLLVSWWPHDNMHRANGMEPYGLVRIEYLFHATLIIAAVMVSLFFWRHITKTDS